jgi:hypothetical protein
MCISAQVLRPRIIYRQDDKLIDMLAEEGIAYVPFFPE